MVAPQWRPPEDERFLGLEFYATETPGLGGRLKRDASDFRVQELSSYPSPEPDGPVTILRVESQGWEQHELTDRLAQQLGIPSQAIRWAGTKDRRAIAERILSYRGPPPPPGRIAIHNVEVREIYQAREELVLGHHYGNRFDLRLRELAGDPGEVVERARAIRAELGVAGGFPNFFGAQRFGEVRPVTHSVGRALVQGDVAGAIDIYLCAIPPGEIPLGAAARSSYSEHRDPSRALREFPPALRFERQLLDHLARGQPPERALRALGRPLRTLFIHAYQAHLFNRYLSRRRAAGLSLLDPVPGDWLLRVARDGTVPGRDPIPVSDDNLTEARTFVASSKARLVGPLVGYATPPLTGRGGELLERILEEDHVTRDRFRLPATPDLASSGNWRPFWCPAPPVSIEWDPPGPDGALRFQFNLPRGTYATVLLREFVKRGAVATSTLSQSSPSNL
ncbi:MAG TPA: tRNA pseudouridine(13) synthase TruD [Thermoplasmata archaeon]|nr:tRNA pseudouridine(13) synthase TruD [Thermoplasmata archaeon]